MARFRATIKGQRGEASRLGGTTSGIRADVNAWNVGIRVAGGSNDRDEDEFTVYLTGGSNNSDGVPIGSFTRADYERLNLPRR